jgi:hypothetical protein
MSDTERLTRSTEAFARLTDQFPKLVNDQREAAINQFLAGLAAERTNLLAGLGAEEQKARALLAETRETLNVGSQMLGQLWKVQWIGIGGSYIWGGPITSYSIGADIAFRF